MRVTSPGTPNITVLLESKRRGVQVNAQLQSNQEGKSSDDINPGHGVFLGASEGVVHSNQIMVKRFNENLLNKEFDLIVIGGGINGCGIARDASERGLRVLLLEKEDFGSGCTSASTRLIHGGLRYLEHFEFGLVKESLTEREILLKNANHLVAPLELVVPIYKSDKRGPFVIKLGMLLYDFLSLGKSLPNHKMMKKYETENYEPGIKADDLRGAAVFYDAQVTYPERICLENALMAEKESALILNHAEVTGLKVEGERINSIEFLDRLTNRTYSAKGKIVINVAGPWVDSLCGLTGKGFKRKIGGTIGSHIVIKSFSGGPLHAVYAAAKSDGRPFFIIPWQNYYLIGTTDIPVDGSIDHIRISEHEIKYLLSEANNILKNKKISYEDILFSYCGVRPLPYIEKSEINPAQITRRHIIFDHKTEGVKNFLSVVGGKLTTYRNLSEQAVDLVIRKLSSKFVPCKTKDKPLLGCIDGDVNAFKAAQLKKSQRKYDLDPEIITHLINLYGKRYQSVLKLTALNPDLGKLLSSFALDIRAQVVHSVNEEHAYTISDILLRRTSLGLNEGMGEDAIPEVAKQLKEINGISDFEIEKQIDEYNEKVVKLRKI